ncbi:CPBP family intramembrane metalloprotease [Methanogenium sp. S4BF]|uniref:CPBP family intramembrane glutamic endopeptidase n=1 Tax=Methanogenium sp. S4BF TaxID=1789226 RepID=UPI0024163C88|nr:type II CAAX endopeptidase family protein [Methanogenium sp. S4BF]WFN34268.1 CPBP family intramembrane metalloprotease [Methanogenium sp. S4BF]
MQSEHRNLLLMMGGLLLISFIWEGLVLLFGGVAGPYFTLMATLLMFFPTIAGLVYLRRTKRSAKPILTAVGKKRYLLAAVLVPVVGTILVIWAAVATGVITQTLYDSATGLINLPGMDGQQISVDSFVLQFIATMMIGIAITSIATFGEEFGWRGVMQNRLIAQYGVVAGLVFLGLFWGIWHAPIIYAGYNFPGYPLLGSLVLMPLFTLGTSGVFAWLTLRSGSFWPAVLAHASFNSTAGPIIYLPVFEAAPLTRYLLFVIPWTVIGIAAIIHLKMTENRGVWHLYPENDL